MTEEIYARSLATSLVGLGVRVRPLRNYTVLSLWMLSIDVHGGGDPSLLRDSPDAKAQCRTCICNRTSPGDYFVSKR